MQKSEWMDESSTRTRFEGIADTQAETESALDSTCRAVWHLSH
jgi:hypothetical protein